MITREMVVAAGTVLGAKATDFHKIEEALEAALQKARVYPMYRARRGTQVSERFTTPEMAIKNLPAEPRTFESITQNTVIEYSMEGFWQVWKQLPPNSN